MSHLILSICEQVYYEKLIREGEVKVNWQRLITQDSLISQAPHNIDSVLDFVGGIDNI